MLTYFGTTLTDLNNINGAGLVTTLIAIVLFLVATIVLLAIGFTMYLKERKSKCLSKATKFTLGTGIVTSVIFGILYSFYFFR
jgi:ABC-type sulfate transport system permease component